MEKWSKLPTDLLFVISDQLGVPDLLRFGAVCRSWHSVIGERRRLRLPHPKIPWIWFNTSGKEKLQSDRAAEFDRLTDCRFYSTRQPEQESKYIGSGYGWLVVIAYKTCDLSLLNPITGKQIRLPPLSTFLDRLCIARRKSTREEILKSPLRFIRKAILTSPPNSGGDDDDNCIVFLVTFVSRPAYARAGRNKSWVIVSNDLMSNSDVICHQGQIYTADERIVSWDFSGPPCVSELKPTFVIKPKPERYSHRLHYPVLVSSPSGDLLNVIITNHNPIIRMEVYKADFEKRDMVKVTSLGEHAIFMSFNSSMCLSVIDLPHLQRDCIYFKNDYIERIFGGPQNGEIGIYNLEDGTIQFPKLGELMIESSCSTWFLPSLA